MSWKTPKITEISVGMEFYMDACADLEVSDDISKPAEPRLRRFCFGQVPGIAKFGCPPRPSRRASRRSFARFGERRKVCPPQDEAISY